MGNEKPRGLGYTQAVTREPLSRGVLLPAMVALLATCTLTTPLDGMTEGVGGQGGADASVGGSGGALDASLDSQDEGAGGSPEGAGEEAKGDVGGAGGAQDGSTNLCAQRSTLESCQTCIDSSCAEECSECLQSESCLGFLNCLTTGCKDDKSLSCASACAQGIDALVQVYNSLYGSEGCAATQCAGECSDLHFENLSQGGAAGAGGDSGTCEDNAKFESNECRDCALGVQVEECSAEAADCMNDPICISLSNCLSACSDTGCYQTCIAGNKEGAAHLSSLLGCRYVYCKSSCYCPGCPSVGSTMCDVCMDLGCTAQCDACWANKECVAIWVCKKLSCPSVTDPACKDSCLSDHPDGQTQYAYLLGNQGCMSTKCPTDCP